MKKLKLNKETLTQLTQDLDKVIGGTERIYGKDKLVSYWQECFR